MSDMFNDYNNNYNQDDRYYNQEENYSYYSDDTSPQKPQKPKKHTGLKIAATLLCLGIGCACGVQATRYMSSSQRFQEDEADDKESSKKQETVKTNNNTTLNPEKEAPAENIPGLFEIAARSDAKYLPDIVDEVMPSVVGISSLFEIEYMQNNSFGSFNPWGWGFESEPETREGIGTGTGIVMTEDGYIVTNAHVIYMEDTDEYTAGEAKEVSILFNDEEKYDAKIVAFDVETDLAVLKIDATGFTPATFGNSDELRVGELVIAVGNPLGFELFGTVTSGIVSARDREISINDRQMTLIQTDTAINEGNSGGPLLNSCGQVVGINSAKMSSSYGSASVEGLGFAIPINKAKEIIDDLVNYKHVKGRPQIGISAVDIDSFYSSYLGLPIGVYVRSIAAGSAAEEAGIRVGDIIIGINDEAVTTMDELNSIKNKFKAGDTITLKVHRDNQDIDVNVVLHEENNEMESSEQSTTEAVEDENAIIPLR
ncbi:MAG: trypsin-like peptidase domain-containing protein [Ruminococcus sp.]|nr:trypsin-like peptidase domain-containing protein [Ruminococcus sp.]